MMQHTIELIYSSDGTVIGQRAKGPIQVDDTLIFCSNMGPVHVKLAPVDMFSATEYRSGNDPIQVKGLGKFRYWCGVVVNGETLGWPEHDRFGSHDDTDHKPTRKWLHRAATWGGCGANAL